MALHFLCGTLLLLALPELPASGIAVAVALVTLVSVAACRRFRMAPLLCARGAGFLYTAFQAHDYLQQRWPPTRADDRVIAQVIIDTVPAARDDGWAFDGEVRIEAPERVATPLRVRL